MNLDLFECAFEFKRRKKKGVDTSHQVVEMCAPVTISFVIIFIKNNIALAVANSGHLIPDLSASKTNKAFT